MQIGILQCDNVRSSLSPEYGEYPQMFEDSFQQFVSQHHNYNFRTYRAHEGILPECVDECDAYIITGSRYSVLDTEELWIHQLQNFVVKLYKAEIKTIGVCFGHQIMAVAMDGKVERADSGWQIGVHQTQVVQQMPYMKPEFDAFNIAMFCEDQVVKVGENAKVIAQTPSCEFAMLQYAEHMLSVQGHPEFSQDFAMALLNVRQEEFPKKRFDNGIESFAESPLDTALLFTWLINFLNHSLDNTDVEAEAL